MQNVQQTMQANRHQTVNPGAPGEDEEAEDDTEAE